MDLFADVNPGSPAAAATEAYAPLPEQLRPQTLEAVVGQSHLLGPGKPLRLVLESGNPHSMIFWGPPGTGKTTLARLVARHCDAEFLALSAVLAGVKEIRECIASINPNRMRFCPMSNPGWSPLSGLPPKTRRLR